MGEEAARAPRVGLLAFALAILLAGCAGRPEGNLIEVRSRAPGVADVDMLVATTRAPVDEPGVMFGGERAIGLHFADIDVSDPARLRAQDRRSAMAEFAARRSRARFRHGEREADDPGSGEGRL